MAIRVLHVAEAAGGVERYLNSLLKYSSNEDVENILICSQNYDATQFKRYCRTVIQLNMAHDIEFSSDIKNIKAIKKAIKQYQPDIAYAHSTKAGALTRLACIGKNLPVIYNPHGWAFNMQQSKLKSNIYKLIEKVQSPFTKKIICISEAEKISALKNKICSADKIQVITNGIDLEQLDSIPSFSREDLNIPKGAFVVGQVGRLSKQKAPDVFVNMSAIIKRRIPNSFFIMVGNGDEEKQIRNQIKSLGLEDSFLLTGWVNNPTAYLSCMDVATLLSRWEGFGLVLAEYMYSGVPLVATNVDAIPYVVDDGTDGLLVNPDAPEDAAQAVIKLHKNKDLAQRLIENGLATVKENYDIQRVVQQTNDLYKEIL